MVSKATPYLTHLGGISPPRSRPSVSSPPSITITIDNYNRRSLDRKAMDATGERLELKISGGSGRINSALGCCELRASENVIVQSRHDARNNSARQDVAHKLT